MGIADLPTLAEMQALRRAPQKGPSRLQLKAAIVKDEKKEEARWKKDVWKRDGSECRWCHRKVVKALELVPNRGECHHIEGRENRTVRWDRRNALLLCASCHERVTGKVNERFVIASNKMFSVDGYDYINGDKPVKFKRVA